MGSYISPKIRASSYGSSIGTSLVRSFFEDCYDIAGPEGREYISEALKQLEAGNLPDQPSTLLGPTDFDLCYQCYNMCRKTRMQLWTAPIDERDMVQDCVKQFLAREADNARVNKLRSLPGWSFYLQDSPVVPEQVIHLARLKLNGLLTEEFDLDEFARSVGFSSGASTRLPRKRGAAPYKFQGKPHVTRNCALLALNLIHFHEPWRLYCQNRFGRESDPFTWMKVVQGSEYFTVPKTATSLRGAAKEPEMNMLCQQGIGNMIRRRLRKVGIDLRDQNRNKNLAQAGSQDGTLATIDLSAASDSVSLSLLDLLPYQWRRFILMTRSEQIKLPDGSWHTLEMVSSMGNGFTFELETLIFWSIASAARDLCCRGRGHIGVYGDDIIVPTPAAKVVIATLGTLGFMTNSAKTFIDGPFRESCGGHYYYGSDVTPFYLRDALKSPTDYYLVANSFNRWAWRFPYGKFQRTQDWMIRHRPRRLTTTPGGGNMRSGLFYGSASDVPGLYFCLRKQSYRYWTYAPLKLGKATSGEEHHYLAWLLKPGGEVSAPWDERVCMYASQRYASWWPEELLRFRNLLRRSSSA